MSVGVSLEHIDGAATGDGCTTGGVYPACRRIVGDVIHPATERVGLEFLARFGIEDIKSAAGFCVATADEETVMGFVETGGNILSAFGNGPGSDQLAFVSIDDGNFVLIHQIDIYS